MVRLSALSTGRLYQPRNIPGTHFCLSLSRTQCHCAAGWILCPRNIPMTPSGIEPTIFRLVSQFLNQLRHSAAQTRHQIQSVQRTALCVTHTSTSADKFCAPQLLYNFDLLRCYAAFVGRNMAERRSCYLGSSKRHKSRKKQLEVAAEITA